MFTSRAICYVSYYETKNLHIQSIHNNTVPSPTCFGCALNVNGAQPTTVLL
jgi:hypothetical protein